MDQESLSTNRQISPRRNNTRLNEQWQQIHSHARHQVNSASEIKLAISVTGVYADCTLLPICFPSISLFPVPTENMYTYILLNHAGFYRYTD